MSGVFVYSRSKNCIDSWIQPILSCSRYASTLWSLTNGILLARSWLILPFMLYSADVQSLAN